MNTYTAVQGDVWDLIAYRVYGDTSLTGYLMDNNMSHLDKFIFDGGEVLNTPPLPSKEAKQTRPVWRV